MPDKIFKLNDFNCKITIHFEDTIQNILKSICSGNHVLTNRPMPSVHFIDNFNNVPELRRMIVNTLRNIEIQNLQTNKEDIKEYLRKVEPVSFKRKLEKIAEKHISKYAKFEDIPEGTKGVYGEA